jgi:hypothetical protein
LFHDPLPENGWPGDLEDDDDDDDNDDDEVGGND